MFILYILVWRILLFNLPMFVDYLYSLICPKVISLDVSS